MCMHIRPLETHIGAEVDGIDLREPLSSAQVEEIHHAMDRYAVLVFHNQPLTNEQHVAFTTALGPLENTMGNTLRTAADHRLPPTFADVSNLDGNNKPFGQDDRRRLFAIGNRLWHSDSSFKAVPAKYSLLRALAYPRKAAIPSSPTWARSTRRSTTKRKT